MDAGGRPDCLKIRVKRPERKCVAQAVFVFCLASAITASIISTGTSPSKVSRVKPPEASQKRTSAATEVFPNLSRCSRNPTKPLLRSSTDTVQKRSWPSCVSIAVDHNESATEFVRRYAVTVALRHSVIRHSGFPVSSFGFTSSSRRQFPVLDPMRLIRRDAEPRMAVGLVR